MWVYKSISESLKNVFENLTFNRYTFKFLANIYLNIYLKPTIYM